MELRDILIKIGKNGKSLTVCVLIGIILGTAAYLMPAKYTASGSLFIGRLTENSQDYFTYEGYYGQQTALTFTNSVSGLLESKEVLTEALKLMDVNINEYSLLKYQRNIFVKKTGPQVITLTVKAEEAGNARRFWEALARTTIKVSSDISENTDNGLRIIEVSQEPVVSRAYKPWWLFLIVGAFSGFTAGIVLISFKEYLGYGGKK